MGNNKYFKDLGYKVTSTYDWRVLNGAKEFHPGVDLVTASHGPIEAFTDGIVVWSGEGVKGSGYGGYGDVVAVKDKNGCVHVYGHLSKCIAKKGATVKKGEVIGNQGSSGHSFGEHLHYEIRKQEAYVADREKRCHVPDEYLEKFYNAKVSEPAKPVAKPAPAPAAGKTYKIEAGDTLSEIATKHKTTVQAILKLNPEIKDASKVRAGQVIKVG